MKTACLAMLASLFVGGCSATTPPNILPTFNPADPAMGIRDSHYHPVVAYNPRQAVDPQDWRRLNERVSPQSGGAGS